MRTGINAGKGIGAEELKFRAVVRGMNFFGAGHPGSMPFTQSFASIPLPGVAWLA